MEESEVTSVQEPTNEVASPVDTTLTVTSGTPPEDVPEPTTPETPVTTGAVLPAGLEPVAVKKALITTHDTLVSLLEGTIKNTEVAAVEGVDALIKGLEEAKTWLVDEVRKYDAATADELALK